MTTGRTFKQVDVFTDTALLGNPVAVVIDAEGMSDEQMQRTAAWTNLSETTFVLPATTAEADYRVRIFTPRSELPFAGHPTLGTAHALLEAGRVTPRDGAVTQECLAGLVPIERRDDGGLLLKLPHHRRVDGDHGDAIRAVLPEGTELEAEPAFLDVGPVWAVARYASRKHLETTRPDMNKLADLSRAEGLAGLSAFYEDESGATIVRSFAPAEGIEEDPVCGSGNGSVAAYRYLAGGLADGGAYESSQGRQIGRDGKISLAARGGEIYVGGNCVTCIDGTIRV